MDVSDKIRDDKDLAMRLFSYNARRCPLLLFKLSDRLRADKEVVLKSISRWGPSYEYASEELKADKEVALFALRKTASLELVPESLRDDHDVVTQAISNAQIGDKPFQFASPRIRDDEEVVKLVIAHDPAHIEYASFRIRDDEEFMLEILSHWGYLLEHASSRLRDMEDICLAAIFQYDWAVQYASTRLQNNKLFNLKVLGKRGNALKFVSSKWRNDKECVLAAVNNDPIALRYALGGLNQDPECLVASGLWQKGHRARRLTEKLLPQPSSHPRVVLSTRFSLRPTSSTTAT